jgi:alcohol dehydrogenase class IV
MQTNVKALEERLPDSDALHRYDELAQLLTGSDKASAGDGIAWVQELCATLRVPPLAAYGVNRADLPTLVENSAVASSMKANPIQLTPDEMREILTTAM